MAALTKEKASVVNFGAWREGRSTADASRAELDELRRELERELEKDRQAIAEERRLLEKDRAAFDEDFAVLEEQRRFLDTQKEKLRLEGLAVEAKREELAREQAAAVTKAAVKARVEVDMDQSRRALEAERVQLQAEMAALLRPPVPKGVSRHAT